MEIPKEAIADLKQIHQGLTGETLSDSQASAMAEDLFRLFVAVYEPLPKVMIDKLNSRSPEARMDSKDN